MYSRILTPLDGSDLSEQVLPYTRELASRLGLPATLLMAVEPGHPSISYALNPLLHSHETEEYRASYAQEYLSSIADRLGESGIAASALGQVGAVNRAGANVDPHLAGAERRLRGVSPDQLVVLHENGFHGLPCLLPGHAHLHAAAVQIALQLGHGVVAVVHHGSD